MSNNIRRVAKMRKAFFDKLVSLMNVNKLDAILVCPSEELKFLVGFTPMMCERFQGLFIKSNGDCFYVCNLLYAGEIRHNITDMRIYSWFDGEDMAEVVYEILKKEGLIDKSIGVNSTAPAFSVLDIAAKTNITFINSKPLFEETRIIKTDEELENLRISASITDKVFLDVIKFIKPGMKEEDVRNFINATMVNLGGTDTLTLVATGPNSSYGHYLGGDRIIEPQDVILLDYGCAYNGMRSDMSRMIFLGSITDEHRLMYDICRKATEAGEAACFEGAYIPDIDKTARDIIEKAGYGEYFDHRLGHGIGYMVHEAPDIKASNRRKLEKGMAFSIEPGINIPGKIGMRVEDIVAITDKGTEILNKSTHELIII
jgi:Xaa-Pro dipeptidase